MKALILAGGFGTRLRPLSCTRPKHLFPIANRPLLDLTLEKLAANGIKEAVLAVNFMARELERVFGKSKYGIKLHFSSDHPDGPQTKRSFKGALGTGGPVKLAERLLDASDPFFVLNGDILTNANYSKIMQSHKKNNGIATIALRKVKDPSRYGVVELASENLIKRFVEKPSDNAPSNLINAGIYVLEPDIFEYIPAGKRCSLEREIFPKLAMEEVLFGLEIKDLWIDVGEPTDFIEANRLWLKAEKETIPHSCNVKMDETVEVKEAVAIDENVIVAKDSIIGPNVALGKDVSIGKAVRIKDSIIFPNTEIFDLTTIENTIIGEAVTIGRRVKIKSGCLIGDNSIIKDGVTIAQDVRICPAKEVFEDILESKCVI